MEHILPAKAVSQVLNTTVTLTWGATDFARAFPESIIKKSVAMRLSCSTTATQAVYIGVRYSTATKDYRVAERKTIAQIPASGSVEVTPSSVAALGLLNEWIISITVELTAASTGTTTVTLIIDDDPPPLSSNPGEFRGLDAIAADDYQIISFSSSASLGPGSFSTVTLYTVPAGKRAVLDDLYAEIYPTPSYPALAYIELQIYDATAVLIYIRRVFSGTEQVNSIDIMSFPVALLAGYAIKRAFVNNDTTNATVFVNLLGREIF